jgi:Predicted glycosyltransferases
MANAQYTPTDRFEELDHADLDGAFAVLRTYCDNLLPDMEACLVFLSRILRDTDAAQHPQTREQITRLVRKALNLGPFNPQCLDLAHRLTGDQAIGKRLQRLKDFPLDPDLLDFRSVMSNPGAMRRKRVHLTDALGRMPGHILAASQLLQLDFYQGVTVGEWRSGLAVPKFFQADWDARLFLHHAGLNDLDTALELWALVSRGPVSEVQLNLAAELLVKTGDTIGALELYAQSLAMDPSQTPIRLRMAELQNPTTAAPALPSQKDVSICLYTWNKADDLDRTLKSLARTNIGRARIRVLLNGCTDHSARVAETSRALFPNNDFAVVALPVNVGAPAARNWLGALPEVRASEFVAYLDDDVELPADWLARFLGVMERHPNTAAVGCKVAFGSDPQKIQYLYRAFALNRPGMIKLTDPCQIAQPDCGHYDFVRTTDTVMGCCHLLRMASLEDGPQFDLRYSPSQVDDIAHDLMLRIRGHEVRYCGLVKCVHHQNTGGGFMRRLTGAQQGQVLGNDMKLYYALRSHGGRIDELMEEARSGND